MLHYNDVLALYAQSKKKKYTVTQDPEAADLIVLVGHVASLDEARQNELLRKYPEKAMVYTEFDAWIAFGPGVYGSAAKPRLVDLRRTRSHTFLSSLVSSRNPKVEARAKPPKDLLFSFRGRRACRVRGWLLDHDFDRPDVLVMDSSDYEHWGESKIDPEQAQEEYVETLLRSHFAVCPRGKGFGSIRMFEAMELGIAPVMLADRYELPVGPDWDSFLLQVPEADYARLPELLERYVTESEERGRRARETWERFFAPEVAFDYLIDQMIEIQRERIIPEKMMQRMWPLLQFRADARLRLSSKVRKTRFKWRRLLGKTEMPHGFVTSDLD